MKDMDSHSLEVYREECMELLDICDEQGISTGETADRDIAHRDMILHRTAHVRVIVL